MILFPIFLFFAISSFSQSKTITVSQDAYLSKSKKQKKTGLILLAGGAVFIATGLIIPKGDPTGHINYLDYSEDHKNDDIKASFGLVGFVAALGAIPFYVASNKNKKRAAKTTVSINHQTINQLQLNSLVQTSQSSLTLKIGL